MYSEENEFLARAAYTVYCADHDAASPSWEQYPAKHLWRDLVQTFQANPRSHTVAANAMEDCVSIVMRTAEAGDSFPKAALTAQPEPDVEPVKPKTAKAAKK